MMQYGRIITTESYFKGERKSMKREAEESVSVANKAELVSEILSGLDALLNGTSPKITLEIEPHDKGYMRIVKKYVIE